MLSGQNSLLYSFQPSGSCIKTLVGHTAAVTTVQFNPDSTLVISCSYDSHCCVWDTQSGNCLKTIISQSQAMISHARLTPNGKYLLIASLDECIRLWDYRKGQGGLLKSFQGNVHSNLLTVVVPYSYYISIQGSHCSLDMKCKDNSMTFSKIFKQNQDVLYQIKIECITHFLKNQFNNEGNSSFQETLFISMMKNLTTKQHNKLNVKRTMQI